MPVVQPKSLKAEIAARPQFLILCAVMFLGAAGMGSVTLLLPVFASEMGASGVWLGLAFSGFAVSQTPLQPLFGGLSDKLGRRKLIAAGFLVYAVVGIGMSMAPSYQTLVALQIAVGVGTALLLPASMAYAGEVAPEGREGAFMGFYNVALFTGFGVGPLIGGNLKDAFGNDAAFLGMTVLTSIAFLIAVFFLPEQRRRSRNDRDGKSDEPDEPAFSFMAMLRLRPVQALVSYQMALTFNAGIAFSFVGVYLTNQLGATAAVVGMVLATRVILAGALQVPGGMIADRWSRKAMIGIGMIAAGIASFFIPVFDSLGPVWVLFAILGIAEAVSTPAGGAIGVEAGRVVGMGKLMGLVATAQSFGLVAGSLLGGVVAGAAGIEQAFRFGSIVALGGAALTLVLLMGVKTGTSRTDMVDEAVEA